MKNIINTLLIILLCFFKAVSQDTILVNSKVYFSSSEKHKYFSKGYIGEYGREDIVFSNNHKIIEYCYYMDSIRICKNREYKIPNDSSLWINSFNVWNSTGNIQWLFKKVDNDRFLIYREDSTFYESGYASTIIPLKIEGNVTTILKSNNNTLWQIKYDPRSQERGEFNFSVELNNTHINEQVYEYYEIDTPPLMLNRDSLPPIHIEEIINCPSEPLKATTKHIISFIVTKDGKIVNIENAIGHLSKHCPYSLMEVIYKIERLGNIKPATKKGKNVNVRWFLPVIEDKPNYIHPAFQDTEENRKRYIKNKKDNK